MKPKQKLKAALLQSSLAWEDPAENRKQVENYLDRLKVKPDFIVLPEMFNTGFTMNVKEVSEKMDGPTINWLVEISQKNSLTFTGSLIIEENGHFFNRMFWIEEGEVKAVYDKRHLFRMAGEHEYFSPGHKSPVIEFRGWKIMPRVCYDLRFPVWNRSSDIDLQIYVANWPKPRTAAWDKLLMARAIENQCYVIGVNRIGSDGNKVQYNGHSIAIDPKGEAISERANENAGWIITDLAFAPLEAFRKKFPVADDADRFQILD